jgi:hypothetical protein
MQGACHPKNRRSLEATQVSSGGESGIRTHVRVSPKHAFQACAFNHSAISPWDSVGLFQFTIRRLTSPLAMAFLLRPNSKLPDNLKPTRAGFGMSGATTMRSPCEDISKIEVGVLAAEGSELFVGHSVSLQ